jgi:hypothetical protein
MRERTRRLDGVFSIRGQGGARIEVCIPLKVSDDMLAPSLDFVTGEPRIN